MPRSNQKTIDDFLGVAGLGNGQILRHEGFLLRLERPIIGFREAIIGIREVICWTLEGQLFGTKEIIEQEQEITSIGYEKVSERDER